MGKRRRVGLILGAGGITGGAWLAGMLPGITAATGSEPGTADLVVGTSAGSVMAALIASRLSARHLTPPNNDVAGDWPPRDLIGRASHADGGAIPSWGLFAPVPTRDLAA